MLTMQETMKLTKKLADDGITNTTAWIRGKSDDECRAYLQTGTYGYSVIVSNRDVLINESFNPEGYQWVCAINNTFNFNTLII